MVTIGVLATSCGGGGGASDPIKIAFVTDCGYPFNVDTEPTFAGADLPFVQRGAKLRGPEASNGVIGATVAGKPVELLRECVAYGDFASLVRTLRRVVESEGADIVVGPDNQGEGLVIKQYARTHRGVTFSTSTSGEQSTTLKQPVSNLFRFAPDTAQGSAGLGAYAYRTLGWRNAVTVGEDDPAGWAAVAGFVAEFCSLGGRIVTRSWPPDDGVPIPARGVDGAVFPSAPMSARSFMNYWAELHPRLGKWLLVNADSDALEGPLTERVRGLVGVSILPLHPAAKSPAGRFEAASKHAFHMQADVYSYDEMEPVLEALEKVHGDLSHRQRAFQTALARLTFLAPNGTTTLDGRHQAIAPTYLRQVQKRHGKLVVRQIAVVPNVEQTFGGYFRSKMPPPGRQQPACMRRKPPAWVNSVPTTR
jgi:branched-chain amino acid transport system substrate-binding protein